MDDRFGNILVVRSDQVDQVAQAAQAAQVDQAARSTVPKPAAAKTHGITRHPWYHPW